MLNLYSSFIIVKPRKPGHISLRGTQKRLAKMTLATCYHYHWHISFGRWSVFCHLVFHPHQKIFSPEEQRNGKQHYF